MAVDATLIMEEVKNISRNAQGVTSIRVDINILAGNTWITPIKVSQVELIRNYEKEFADHRTVRLLIGKGDYTYAILPNRKNLKIDVHEIPTYVQGGQDRSGMVNRVKRYHGVLLNQDNYSLGGMTPQSSNREDLNKEGLVSVEIEMLDTAAYQIRMNDRGGIYRKTSPLNLARVQLSTTMDMVDSNNQQLIKGVSVIPGYNTEIRNQISIPHGTKVTDIVPYLQHKGGGIYPAGAMGYLQEDRWYIYPPYNVELFKQITKTLTVLMVPPHRTQSDRTYRINGDNLTVAITGDRNIEDTSNFDHLNDATGYRFGNANVDLQDIGVPKDNKLSMNRRENMYEFSQTTLHDDYVNVHWAGDQRVTSNPYPHYSRLAMQQGRRMEVEWNHGDSSLIYPGMPVKVYAAEEDKLSVYQGTVLGLMDVRASVDPGVVNRFPVSIRLYLFIVKVENN